MEHDEDIDQLEPAEETDQEGIRSWPRYDVRHAVFVRFKAYLMGLDGGQRSEKTAQEIVVDVSKCYTMHVEKPVPTPIGPKYRTVTS